MIPIILFFLCAYITSYAGFLLGRATREEHKEIYKKVLLFTEGLVLLFCITMFYITRHSSFIIVFFATFIFYALTYRKTFLQELSLSSIYTVTFLYVVDTDYAAIIAIPIIALFLRHSLIPFSTKRQIYSIAFTLLLYSIFSIIVKSF